jgi:glycosyltransferase involved in cell wall biosynthesis
VEALIKLPGAALSGFHHSIDLGELPRIGTHAELGGFGVGLDGRGFPLPPVVVSVAAPAPQLAAAMQREPIAPTQLRREHLTPAARRRQLRLLVCTHELGYGGAQLFLTELLRQISDIGPISGLVLSPNEGPTRRLLEEIGFDVHVTSAYPIGSLDAYDARLDELAGWAASKEFDAALVNTMVAFPGGDLASRIGVPTVWAIHESYPLPALWAGYGDALDPGVRGRAEAALGAVATAAFTCEATRACYEPYFTSLRWATLPYGIDVDALDRWREDFDRVAARQDEGIREDATVILCLGTIEPRKAQTQLIHAFAQIADRHPTATLMLVGSRGDQYSQAAQAAALLHGVQDRVRIQPVIADVRPSYAISDLLVSASDVESTPRSMLEAMALGLPVLGTDVFGVPELITDGRSGWLCEPRDVTALATALDRVLSLDAAQRLEVAGNARAIVETEYRSDVCSREWDRTLREIAAGASPRRRIGG